MKPRLTPQARERKLHFKNTVSPQDGGTPALNFVNTLKNRGAENSRDYLTNYEDFIYWCYEAKVISYDYYQELSLEGYCYFKEAASVFEEVIKTRFMLHQIFLSIINGEPADEIFVREFNTAAAGVAKYLQFESTAGGMRRMWVNIDEEIPAPLCMVVQSAADLLLLTDPKKIKKCKTCGSLFFDRTRNGTRRWCNPLACKSLVKAQKYYHAKKIVKDELCATTKTNQ
ncbi:MAG TPA: CGNR zinc finger domain-containing protein [Mucilaginibacter sp.]|jgi:predicted RNA-binding Zn ribbon-like protein